MYRKTYEVIGYTYDGTAYCLEHASNKDNPVFLGTEGVETLYCDTCYREWFESATIEEKRMSGAAPRWIYLESQT